MVTKRDVYLFGVKRHSYQIPNDKRHPIPPQAYVEFTHCIEAVITQRNIAGIAEEMSQEALKARSDSDESILCRLALKVSRPYRLCDLYPNTSDYERERTWSCQLNSLNVYPVLFVLGADHVDRFNRLLTESGFLPFIIEHNWKASSDQNDVI
jgi:hypothetical protein